MHPDICIIWCTISDGTCSIRPYHSWQLVYLIIQHKQVVGAYSSTEEVVFSCIWFCELSTIGVEFFFLSFMFAKRVSWKFEPALEMRTVLLCFSCPVLCIHLLFWLLNKRGKVRWSSIIVVERYLTMLFQNNSTLDIFFFETWNYVAIL
jgi:hypothetical protein